jgi:hypothetical protein
MVEPRPLPVPSENHVSSRLNVASFSSSQCHTSTGIAHSDNFLEGV